MLQLGPYAMADPGSSVPAMFRRAEAMGEGKFGENEEGARAHLPVVSVVAEVVCGGLSTEAGGRR